MISSIKDRRPATETRTMSSTPPAAPSASAPWRVGRTAGWGNVVGGVAAGITTLPTWASPTSGTAVVLVLSALAAVCGVGTLRWGALLPRWSLHVLVGQAGLMIAVAVVCSESNAAALATAGIFTFCAVDHVFFHTLRRALLRSAALLVPIGGALLWRDVHPSAVAALVLVELGMVAVIGLRLRGATSAQVDDLTGLADRRAFDGLLERWVQVAGRKGEPLSVVLLDVDDFKEINATQGSAAGDTVLAHLAADLAHELRTTAPHATLARLGGDEFAVIARGCTVQAALELAERLRSVAAPVGVSAGVAQLVPGEDAPRVTRRAAAALHQAKSSGRGRILASTSDDLQLIQDLTTAISANAISVALQPLVDPSDGRLLGVEALARWIHPERGFVSPAEFIQLAEEHGLVVDLGAVILRRALAEAEALREEIGHDFLLTFNVSGKQLVHPGFVNSVVDALVGSGWNPKQLVVEVTESVVDASSAVAREALEDLRWCGIQVAIDDFGTGYSCLSRLDELPVDFLKLDSGFIGELLTSPRRRAVMAGMLAMSRAIGLVVIAEGVETLEQAQLLVELDCPLAQGYHFARPATAAVLAEHYRASGHATDRPAAEPAP
ncbi:diguanylate cyclase (GGDEF) domain-containing protein [Quadrisphaera granulorum]|uniref:Diguanylate cyclase (GGDEF)-like protein n=1 Tax=Quadrisphaera granulorum TaxID=317664 RepID=A0A316A0L5_9ACTN|nr:bifunctional diguanylate cyclase/phosphodiesterase [Quadrisphaera granulorum]PWJ51133.1 diguanylate cyclase (GGDEF)-like protein [Quadrisphaera granulorum]SZE97783.1 diguanylate cyclase (GGDEF) domain-containing protein [Quadrisphaera granulorum]